MFSSCFQCNVGWIGVLQQEDDEMLVPHSDIADNHQPMEGLV